LARHRSPSGDRPRSNNAHVAPESQQSNRARGAHRIPSPGPAARGRIVVAAVAFGATAAATQGLQQPQSAQASGLQELGFDNTAFNSASFDTAGYTGMGGNAPAAGVLPLPEVMPAGQNSADRDLSGLAKGQRIAEGRATEAKAAAERAAAEQAAAKAKADQEAKAREAAEKLKSSGGAVLPAVGELTSGFGARWGTNHKGIDIANSIGTPIHATMAGEVIDSGPASGFGMWVRLQHADGTISVYGHINESMVSVGQQVAAGEQIATIGNRGQTTGPHLHFEIWLNGEEKIDPLSWLRAKGVNI
jgi:murein DD-endopeptidase MepM/ murein hydrolase activator NlpD